MFFSIILIGFARIKYLIFPFGEFLSDLLYTKLRYLAEPVSDISLYNLTDLYIQSANILYFIDICYVFFKDYFLENF